MTKPLLRAVSAVTALAVAGGLASVSFASDAAPRPGSLARAAVGSVAVVQAVPQEQMTVTVDGEQVQTGVAEGKIVPLDLAPGAHDVTFTDSAGGEWTTSVDVTEGATTDVVVHRPAEVGGQPTVSVYPMPTEPLAPGKARIMLAHTATTAPADVVMDGTTVFTNIANGEFARADVAAGPHEVSLLPAGVKGSPILGPLDVDLEAGTTTAVYAVGNPQDGSMNVIVNTVGATASDSEAPTQIDTGSAGLVGGLKVWTFSTR